MTSNKIQYNINYIFYFLMLIISVQFIVLFIHLYSLGSNIPLLLLLRGDPASAGEAKKLIITGSIGFFKKPIIGYWLKYYFYFVPLFAYYSSFLFKKNIFKIIFIISIIISLFYFMIDGHKSVPVTFLFIFVIYRSMFVRQSNVKLFFASCSLVSMVFIYYLASFDLFGRLQYGTNRFLQRLFVLQGQGLYYIYEFIEPSFAYVLPLVPFTSIMFPGSRKADAIVMEYLFGPSSSNVNMNSLFIAETYSFSGMFGVIISPFHVWSIIIILSLLLRRFTRKDSLFFIPLAFSVVPHIPFTQNISYFIFPKELVSISILFFILYVIFLRTRKSKYV